MNRDKQQFLRVGYHKGEMDFGVNTEVRNLTYKQMKELREMIVVAIGSMEIMWANAQQEKSENQAKTSNNKKD